MPSMALLVDLDHRFKCTVVVTATHIDLAYENTTMSLRLRDRQVMP